MLARYNWVADQRLVAKCDLLDDAEHPKERAGSFGSIHGLLNHILLGDRRWMSAISLTSMNTAMLLPQWD
jgi:uncharacterized damage-inducible protein DinB